MELKMRNGVLIVSGEGKVIEVFTGDDGELEILGNVVVEEEEPEEEIEEIIEFPDEPDMPNDIYRNGHYPLIGRLKIGDKVRLRLDLDEEEDDIKSIGLYAYYEYMLKDLADRDLIIENITKSYDEVSNGYEDHLSIDGWHLSTRWVTKVE